MLRFRLDLAGNICVPATGAKLMLAWKRISFGLGIVKANWTDKSFLRREVVTFQNLGLAGLEDVCSTS